MTRKRFIKLLMSMGYNRNGAHEYADVIAHGNYTTSYRDLLNYVLCVSDMEGGY